MLHGSETWPVRKENEVAFQLAEIRMVRWTCNVKVTDTVPSKELRDRLGIDDIIWYYSKTGCNGMAMCSEKKTLTAWRNIWSMKWRAPNQEKDQRGLGQRLRKKTVKHINWTGRILWIIVDGRSWWRFMIRIGEWVNVSSGTGTPWYSRTKGHKMVVVQVQWLST